MELLQHFITTQRAFKEGTVEVFQQNIPTLPIKKAILSITALGMYEAEINGEKVGEQMFAPGYTYYYHDLRYQNYDVTEFLHGEDTLRVYLGQGWYCGRFTCDNKTQIYGKQPAVSWMLELELTDGSRKYFASDDSSVQAVQSPYGYAGIYDGEIYYADGAEHCSPDEILQPLPYDGPLPKQCERTMLQVKCYEEMPVQKITKNGDVTILDFGQNFAGIVEIDPTKMSGTVLKLRHGEILNQDGSLYTKNLRKAKAEIIYHKGRETKKYRPRFTYMGFRYVEVSGTEYVPGMLTAYVIHSEMERTGYFSCENKLVDRLYQNQLWGQKSNYVEVATDCPQRDERMGYSGDGHVYALTGSYNYDTEKFWDKFLQDVRNSQKDNSEGYVGPIIPAEGPSGVGFITMLGWGNAVTIIPEMLYWQYGTDQYLKTQYESMKSHVECEIRHMGGPQGKENLWLAPNLGDWLSPGKDIAFMAQHNGPVSNAFIINDLRIMTWTAEYLGNTKDAARYCAQLEKTRTAYCDAFVNEDGSMKDDYQGAYIMALRFVIPKGEELWNKMYAKLLEKLRTEGMQTGFFSTEHLLPLLADNGQIEFAYDLLLQENCPGWMYQVLKGATTIWERWDAIMPDGTVNESDQNGDNMVSFNHYAFGSVGEFYYRYILGIQPLEPAYTKVRIAPHPDKRLGRVNGSFQTRHGKISVSWEQKGEQIELHVETPTETELVLPDNTINQIEKGSYVFHI